jgi:hypothetical protein
MATKEIPKINTGRGLEMRVFFFKWVRQADWQSFRR